MADNPSFEIPPELRDFAEKNVEQARAAYGQFMDFMTKAMTAWSDTPGADTMTGFKAVQDKAVAFAKENSERSFALASDLARAKDIQEVLTLQTRYAQTQQGLPKTYPRAPMPEASAAQQAAIRSALAGLGVLGAREAAE